MKNDDLRLLQEAYGVVNEISNPSHDDSLHDGSSDDEKLATIFIQLGTISIIRTIDEGDGIYRQLANLDQAGVDPSSLEGPGGDHVIAGELITAHAVNEVYTNNSVGSGVKEYIKKKQKVDKHTWRRLVMYFTRGLADGLDTLRDDIIPENPLLMYYDFIKSTLRKVIEDIQSLLPGAVDTSPPWDIGGDGTKTRDAFNELGDIDPNNRALSGPSPDDLGNFSGKR